jgi:hypothetical protein
METEPSDRFWNKAYEGILKKESEDIEKKLLWWKGAAGLLAAAAVTFIGYSVYTSHKMTGIEQRVANLEKQQPASNGATVAVNESVNQAKITALTNSAEVPSSEKNEMHAASQNNVAANIAAATNPASVSRLHNVSHSANPTKPFASKTPVHQSAKVAEPSAITSRSTNSVGQNVTGSLNNAAVGNSGNSNINNAIVANASNAPVENTQIAKSNPLNKITYLETRSLAQITMPSRAFEPSAPEMAIVRDTGGELLPLEDRVPIAAKKSFISKCYLSFFIAPAYATPIVTGKDPISLLTPDGLKSMDKQILTYSFGANFGFELADRVSLSVGLSYQRFIYSINFNGLIPQSNIEGPNYLLPSYSGTIPLSSINNNNNITYSSANGSGNAELVYFCVPFKLKYGLLKHHVKWNLYVTGGASINFFATDYTTLNYNNALGNFTPDINYIQGTNSVNLALLAGFGIQRSLGQGCSIFIEPTYQASLTPVASASLSTYLDFTNLTLGFSYHF